MLNMSLMFIWDFIKPLRKYFVYIGATLALVYYVYMRGRKDVKEDYLEDYYETAIKYNEDRRDVTNTLNGMSDDELDSLRKRWTRD